jgi:hypothetical protein
MILDANLLFTGGTTGTGNSDGKTDSPTTGTAQAGSNVIDLGLTGLPASITGGGGGGARDIGIGDDPALKLMVLVTTAFTGGTSLQILVQGAPDNGSGAPGSYTTMINGFVTPEASLIAGARLLDIDMPRPSPGQSLPRYLRLAYTSVGSHSAGALEGALVVDRMDQIEQSNAVMGGYPAGVTVAN